MYVANGVFLLLFNFHATVSLETDVKEDTETFEIVDSTTCESNGMLTILSKSECETAARFMGLKYTSAYVLDGTRTRPHGCIFNRLTDWLGFYDITNGMDRGTCGSKQYVNGNTYDCLCKHVSGYVVTAEGVTCSDKGMVELDDSSECQTAITYIQDEIPGASFDSYPISSNSLPVGCYYFQSVYWNTHSQGGPCSFCRSICKGCDVGGVVGDGDGTTQGTCDAGRRCYSDGTCVTCTASAECTGIDVCINPGTFSAECVTPACTSNDDCLGSDVCGNPSAANAFCGCTAGGIAGDGDGTTQGTCDAGLRCYANGRCGCDVGGAVGDGDGTTQGTCDAGLRCYSDGTCDLKKCTSHMYDSLYIAAYHNNLGNVRTYVEENGCCPTVAGGGVYDESTLWIARKKEAQHRAYKEDYKDVVAYLESIDCRCFENDFAYPGNDIGEKRTANSPEDCQQLCKNTDGCVAFTFRDNRKGCWLKNIKSAGEISTGAISGNRNCKADECKTTGDNQPNRNCVFPFWFGGTLYESCTTVNAETPWCATEVDSDGHQVSEEWGFCAEGCPVTTPEIYVLKTANDLCSTTGIIDNLDECKSGIRYLKEHGVDVVFYARESDANYPKGCYKHANSNVFWNTHISGNVNLNAHPICKEDATS